MSNPPFVIHVSEIADFPDAVYIGRGNGRKRLKRSRWHNPFGVKSHGRDGAIQCFRNYMSRGWDETEALLVDLPELTGKPLACWCRRSDEERTDDNACHGDVLVELWKEHNHD